MNEQSKEKNSIKWLMPLSPRIGGDISPEDSLLKKVFFVISPVIIYVLYVGLLTQISQMILEKIADSGEMYARYISANRSVINAGIRTVVILLATLAQFPALKGEKPILISRDGKLARYAKSILLGISSAVCLNVLLSITGLTAASETYKQVADKQFALPVIMGILLYGIVSPLAEEVIFRGIIYNRMRRNDMKVLLAMIMSSVLFGSYHLNMVQAVYGALMGLLIVWIYERYGGFLYPVLFHASANIMVYILSASKVMGKIMTPVTVIVSGAIMVFVIGMVAQENKS